MFVGARVTPNPSLLLCLLYRPFCFFKSSTTQWCSTLAAKHCPLQNSIARSGANSNPLRSWGISKLLWALATQAHDSTFLRETNNSKSGKLPERAFKKTIMKRCQNHFNIWTAYNQLRPSFIVSVYDEEYQLGSSICTPSHSSAPALLLGLLPPRRPHYRQSTWLGPCYAGDCWRACRRSNPIISKGLEMTQMTNIGSKGKIRKSFPSLSSLSSITDLDLRASGHRLLVPQRIKHQNPWISLGPRMTSAKVSVQSFQLKGRSRDRNTLAVHLSTSRPRMWRSPAAAPSHLWPCSLSQAREAKMG